MNKSCRRPLKKQLGMTLLELVAATLLAAMLCVAVLGMTADCARRQQQIVSELPARPWLAPLSEQIRWDILQARSFRLRADSLELHGFGSRDFSTAVAYHGPAVITYQVVTDGNVRWLLRKELHVDDLSNQYFRAEFVCGDIGSIKLCSLAGRPDVAQLNSGPLSGQLEQAVEQDLPGEGPLPERVVVTIRTLKDRAPLLREIICRR